jgi:hypothetical protein
MDAICRERARGVAARTHGWLRAHYRNAVNDAGKLERSTTRRQTFWPVQPKVIEKDDCRIERGDQLREEWNIVRVGFTTVGAIFDNKKINPARVHQVLEQAKGCIRRPSSSDGQVDLNNLSGLV